MSYSYNDYYYGSTTTNACHTGNPLVFTTNDGIEVYAGGSSRSGGWWLMKPLPDLAMGPDNEVKKGYAKLKVDTKHQNMDGWSCIETLQPKDPPAVLEMDFPDYGVPVDCDRDFWLALANDIREREVKTIHVMCMGGHGRTGIQLACLRWHLASDKERKEWPDANALITDIRDAYCKKAVEATSQQEYVAEMCDIPSGKLLSFHKYSGGSSWDKKSSSTSYARTSYTDGQATIVECTNCDFMSFSSEDDRIQEQEFCWDYGCQGSLQDVTDFIMAYPSITNENDNSCLCLTSLDVTSPLNVLTIEPLTTELMVELHGDDWEKILQQLMNKNAKTSLRGQMIRALNQYLTQTQPDSIPPLVCITDIYTDERMQGSQQPNFSTKEGHSTNIRVWQNCGFCGKNGAPHKHTWATQTTKAGYTIADLICPNCVVKQGGFELYDRVTGLKDGIVTAHRDVGLKSELVDGKYIEFLSPSKALNLRNRRHDNSTKEQKKEAWYADELEEIDERLSTQEQKKTDEGE